MRGNSVEAGEKGTRLWVEKRGEREMAQPSMDGDLISVVNKLQNSPLLL